MNQMESRKRQFTIGTRMLGLVTMILLVNLIGDLGMAYLGAALEVYMLLQLLFTACVPDCVEKLIRSRMAKGQYRNVDKVCKVALGYCLLVGILGCLLLLALAGLLTEGLLQIPEASLSLKLLAPAFFLNAVSAILQGYFQGIGTAMPTVVAGMVKQGFSLLFAVLFAYLLYGYGEKAAALLHSARFANMYGAAGAALGLLCGVLFAFVFLLLIYLGAGRRARKQKTEGMRLTEDSFDVLKLLAFSMAPAAAIGFLLRAGTLISLIFYQAGSEGSSERLVWYGAYYGKYLVLAGLFTAAALILCTRLEKQVIYAIKKEEYKGARDTLKGLMQTVFLFTVFFAAISMVLAPYLMKALFGEGSGTDYAITCMQHGFLLPVFLAMGISLGRILNGIGRRKPVLLNLLGAFIFQVLVAAIGLKVTGGNGLVLVYAQLLSAAVLCGLNGFFLLKAIRLNLEWLRMFLFPAIAAGVTGLCLFMLGKALITMLNAPLTFLLCLLAGVFCYLILLFVLRCIREKDLNLLPGGTVLGKIGNFLHLL